MIRLRHPFAAFLLALLLVGVQYGGELHALEHAEEALKQSQDQSFSAPGDEICALCALFAGGANAVANDVDHTALTTTDDTIPRPEPASFAAPAPAWYSSRAPPSLL